MAKVMGNMQILWHIQRTQVIRKIKTKITRGSKKKSNNNQCYFANLIDDLIFVIADRLSLIKIDVFITLYRIIIY